MKTTIFALFLIASMAAFAAEKGQAPARSQVQSPRTHAQTLASEREAEYPTTDSEEDFCYTMRVYMFEAKDGEPPQMKGMKTCVGSNPRILKKTAAPKAQFKLLK